MRFMTYNVRNCRGMDGRISPERIAAVIERFQPDVVALQELDRHRRRSGHLDQARVIADVLAMESHFHPAMHLEDEQYGDAILTRHPLRMVRAGILPQLPRQIIAETRGALWVEIEAEGAKWQVINTHLGLGRAERRAQAAALLGPEWAEAAARAGPLVLCGDFNSPARRGVHAMFTARLRDAQMTVTPGSCRSTFSTRFPIVCLDYFFVSDQVEVLGAEVPRSALLKAASDHFPLVVDLRVAGSSTGILIGTGDSDIKP